MAAAIATISVNTIRILLNGEFNKGDFFSSLSSSHIPGHVGGCLQLLAHAVPNLFFFQYLII